MYFQTPFPVPSLKQLSVKFLPHWEGLRSFCSVPDFCHHNYFGHWGAWTNFDQGLSLLDKIVNFAFYLVLTSTNIEKTYDMGIIRIYRSSVTHWCKFGVHTLCCSHDRAVFMMTLTPQTTSWASAHSVSMNVNLLEYCCSMALEQSTTVGGPIFFEWLECQKHSQKRPIFVFK